VCEMLWGRERAFLAWQLKRSASSPSIRAKTTAVVPLRAPGVSDTRVVNRFVMWATMYGDAGHTKGGVVARCVYVTCWIDAICTTL